MSPNGLWAVATGPIIAVFHPNKNPKTLKP
jgi:hypothetical protein